jgi:predicted dehydrogenase
MNRVRLGMIGCGSIVAWRHLPALIGEVPEIEVVALCNRGDERLHRLGDQYRIPRSDRYTDYHPLIARQDIDALLIAASPAANYEIGLQAARTGKHLFVEKPMAETATQARALAVAIATAEVKFQVGFNKRFYYAYREAKRLMEEGRIGIPTAISARFWFPPTQRRSLPPRRQVLVQNGIHFLDLVQFFMGSACEVFARAQETEGRVTCAATVAFEEGGVGNILLSSLGSWTYLNERLDIVGSNGAALSAENGRKLMLFVDSQPALSFERTLSAHWVTGNDEAGFAPQLKAFATSILHGQATPSGPQDGIRSLLLAEAIEQSIQMSRPVSIPSVDPS